MAHNFLICLQNLLALFLAEIVQSGSKIVVAKCEDANGEKGSIGGSVHTYCGNGHAWRHLNYTEQSVEAIKHSLYGDTNNGNLRLSCYHARQGCRHACSCDNDANATFGSTTRIRLNLGGCAMGAKGANLEGYAETTQSIESPLHYRKVGLATHYHTYKNFFHIHYYIKNIQQKPQRIPTSVPTPTSRS